MNDPASKLKKFERFTEAGQAKIAEICRAAAQVFYEKGYLSATLADVASAAGLTKGAIFHYFSTKEELLFLILYRYYESALADFKRQLESNHSPQDKIFAYIRSFIMGYRDRQVESRLALNERINLSQSYLQMVKDKEREFVKILRSLVADLLGKKEQNHTQVTLLTYSLLGMLTWPYRWFDPRGESSPEELAQIVYKIFIGDLKIHPRKKPNRRGCGSQIL
ncbi:MAG: TetR/AcrR family transcriptional regulator [Thermodesulfobacteriota bacterium]